MQSPEVFVTEEDENSFNSHFKETCISKKKRRKDYQYCVVLGGSSVFDKPFSVLVAVGATVCSAVVLKKHTHLVLLTDDSECIAVDCMYCLKYH